MVKAHASKETFWNNERVKRGWSFKYIAKKTGIPQTTLGYWFSGAKSPRNERHIQQLCELFDIPFDTGYNAFYHAERTWDSDRKTQHVYKTFWNELREKNNLSLEDISEITGIKVAGVSSNFSGRNIPRGPALEKYCKLFDISIEQGKEEFQKAHEQYIALKNGEPSVVIEEPKEILAKDSSPNVVDYTFWPSTFANSQFTIKDVADYLNVDEAKVEKYFTGEVVPNFNQIRMLCGLYGGIDLTSGKDAFNLLHEHFVNTPTTSVPEDSDESDDIIVEIMRPFFDEVSYDKFVKIQAYLNKLDKNTLNLVYSIYNNISNIMNN